MPRPSVFLAAFAFRKTLPLKAYSFWGIGGIDPEQYERARKASRVEQDIPVNHSEFFAPVIERRGDKAPDKAAPQPPVEIPSAPSTEHVASMRS